MYGETTYLSTAQFIFAGGTSIMEEFYTNALDIQAQNAAFVTCIRSMVNYREFQFLKTINESRMK